MIYRKISRAASFMAFTAAGALGFSAPAMADDYVLATSKAHKLQILADGGASWCGQNLKLRMVLEADSPDAGNQMSQLDIMNRLKTPIANDCKTAVSADLTVIDPGKPGATYRATVSGGWTFAAVATAAPVASAPTPATPPVTAPLAAAPATSSPAAPVALLPTPAQPSAPPAASALAAPAKAEAQPREMNYWGGLLRWVRDNPGLAQDDAILRLWAFHRYSNEYNMVQNQEFKLQPLLQRAKADLADTLSQGNLERVTVVISTQFGSYDFANQRFPLSLGNVGQVTYSEPCCGFQKAPMAFVVKLEDLDSLTGLPMAPATAQAFTERRTRWGSVNRSLYIAVTVNLRDGGFQSNGWNQAVALGAVDSAIIYGDERMSEPLFQVSTEDFAKWREAREAEKAAAAKVAAEREAEQRRQQLMAQREQSIRALASASPSVRLANFISTGDLNYYASLSNLRSARSAALINGKAVQVLMLIQADSSGRADVATNWPGLLKVTVPDGLPELKSSEWYLVRGLLNVPDGGGLPAAQLMAEQIYVCTQPKCTEAADAAAVVDRKLAAQGGAQ